MELVLKEKRFCSHAGAGAYLNIYGNEAVSKNRDVCIWSLSQHSYAQKWLITKLDKGTKIISALNSDYALNYYWAKGKGKAGNCDIYPHLGNDEDSFVEVLPITSLSDVYKIKLSNYDLYLTAGGTDNAANVTWEIESNSIAQLWKIENVSVLSFVYPTNTRKLSQGYHSGHKGIDIPAVVGTPVYAFSDGVVAAVQSSDISWHPNKDTSKLNGNSMQSMGNMITINHNNPDNKICNGIYARSIYMHLQKAPTLKPLDIVKSGDLIGYVGNTGRSTGAHLHFSLAIGDKAFMAPGQTGWESLNSLALVDPRKYLSDYQL